MDIRDKKFLIIMAILILVLIILFSFMGLKLFTIGKALMGIK